MAMGAGVLSDMPGLCDCHVHVFGPQAAYPLAAERTYTPDEAPFGQLAAMLDRLGAERVVLIQPSPYGTDNRCLFDALATLKARGRGILVLDNPPSAPSCERLHGAGVRGIRLNVATAGGAAGPAALRARIDAEAGWLHRMGWHVEVHITPDWLAALCGEGALPIDVVIDHMGKTPREPAARQAALDHLRAALETGRVWLKLSGADRISGNNRDWDAAAAVVEALVAANPERLVWGSDWPHTPFQGRERSDAPLPFRPVDTVALRDTLARWVANADSLRRILVDNPRRLYGFE